MLTGTADALTCDVSQSCSGTVMLRMQAKYNAHAELPSHSPPDFPWLLCCSDAVTGVGTDCGAANARGVVLLSGQTNAHAATTYGSFPFRACISTPGQADTVECMYGLDSCPGGYACLASLYGNTMQEAANSHISACDDPSFRLKVCCRISVHIEVPKNNVTEFATRKLFMPHDTTEVVRVLVKNNYTTQPADMLLYLEGPAKFEAGASRITPAITADGKSATFLKIPPNTEDFILVAISPLLPLSDGVYTITVTGTRTVGAEGSTETDTLEVVSHQPPTFSGIGWAHLAPLFALSALAFHLLMEKVAKGDEKD